MRNMSLRRIKSFTTFDLPINYHYLYSSFRKTHESNRNLHPGWPVVATRCKLIANYWGNAFLHYFLIIVTSALVTTLILSSSFATNASISFLLGALLYIPVHFMIYRPTYNNDFLPKLETVIAEYEGKERAWQEKCKQDQLNNRVLVFLFYVLDKASKLNSLSATDKWANQLHKIFGVSPKGMKNELDLVFKEEKKAKLEQRHRLEIAKSFEGTYNLLESWQFAEGVRVLKELEQRFNRPRPEKSN